MYSVENASAANSPGVCMGFLTYIYLCTLMENDLGITKVIDEKLERICLCCLYLVRNKLLLKINAKTKFFKSKSHL